MGQTIKQKMKPSVQDAFLEKLMAEKRWVAIYLVNGIKLEGEIGGFDQHTIYIKGKAEQCAYKNAICSLQPLALPAVTTPSKPQPRKIEISVKPRKRLEFH